MEITTQLALFLDNRPGMLASVCEALNEANVNIYALTVSDTVDHSVIRLLVSDTRKALLLFEERGTLVVETEVVRLEASNKPGSLGQIAKKLADAGVNIEYCYGTTPLNAEKGTLVLRVSDAQKALQALKK
jgi:hypothetical protein